MERQEIANLVDITGRIARRLTRLWNKLDTIKFELSALPGLTELTQDDADKLETILDYAAKALQEIDRDLAEAEEQLLYGG